MNKFEQLIEYVINDDEAKARELFHDIVVEKSRTIYEEMMAADEAEEVEEAAEDQNVAEAGKPDVMRHTGDKTVRVVKKGGKPVGEIGIDAGPGGNGDYYVKLYDGSYDAAGFATAEEALEELRYAVKQMSEGMGGDQADDLIDDIETEESGVSMEGEEEVEMDAEFGDEEGSEDLEDRVVDLEDKLDELMAEFESLMGDDAGGDEMDAEMDMEVGDDMDSEEVVDDELETEGMYENVDLKAAPKPVTAEEGGVNKKSTVAANSGAKGAVAKPVSMTGDTAHGRTAPTAKDMGSTTQPNVKPATKPHLAQASGVNTKSVIQ